MEIILREVKVDEKQTLINLYEKYSYEWSQYNPRDVNKSGLYCDERYDFDCYMQTERKCIAYFIEVDDNLAGFALIYDIPEIEDIEVDYIINEFFVMYKYRRLGVGRKAVYEILDRQKGKWFLYYNPKNISSVHFWNNAINEYTGGTFELIKSYPNTEYEDGTLADVFFFTT